MYVVIGKIEAQGNNVSKLEACRIFDTDTKEVKDISITKIRKALKNGVRVVGFKIMYNIDATTKKGAVRSNVSRNNTAKFRWRNIPRLTGKGELINTEDAKYMTVIGWSGFAEMKKYHLIDWQGKETLINIEEFIEKVKAEEVNGVSYDSKYNKPLLSKELNEEYT